MSDTPPDLWQFVPLRDYQLPGLPARSAANNAWGSFKQLFRRPKADPAPFKQDKELSSLAEVRLAHLVAPIPNAALAKALELALHDWLEEKAANRACRFVISQPFCPQQQTLQSLAQHHQAPIIAAPTHHQILDNDPSWFNAWPSEAGFWVLPHLEHCYLRQAAGLNLLRQLFHRLDQGELGKGLIACDSWAWAYLQHILPLPRGQALTLQAFDAERLQRLFSQMVQPQAGRQVRFSNATTGRDIICVPSEQARPPGEELVQLAAYCRGNVALALHYWRERLRSEPDASLDTDAKDAANADQDSASSPLFEENLWVTQMLPEPNLPVGNSEEQILMLHALLLHGGLDAAMLAGVLPLSPNRSAAVLSQLYRAGLIGRQGPGWYLRPSAYASVRRLLRVQDYLVDEF
ncbi:MAG: hypothetical protein H7842_01555 [Gammaproteobacteria bacterium SHHR-1]|uniref:hypothetical protein n=1 Tax=Magnetovirga frankeli TaxID=947516 RepID=UPI001292D9C3|nr:hypothetical protein D5125_05075 [gamma proteobacterium SS-5]